MLTGKEFIGFCKDKKKYYYGFKVHMITNSNGQPIEFLITAACVTDITAFKMMDIDLPSEAMIYGDKAYNDYKFEDELMNVESIQLIAQRKPNLKRQHSLCMQFLQGQKRKRIETAFSLLTGLFPRKISAVAKKGFLLKLLLFIISFAVHKMF